MDEVLLRTGEFCFGAGCARMRTVLGSCISVTMWRPDTHTGGMCHFMLPDAAASPTAAPRAAGLYADQAIELFARAIERAGGRPQDYVVKIFGGGRMFGAGAVDCAPPCPPAKRKACPDVGCKNIQAARETLQLHGFAIVCEDVGGCGSRDVIFDVSTGEVWVRRGAAVGVAQ